MTMNTHGATRGSTLQHAAHLTGGLYLQTHGTTQRALAHYLVTSCLPDQYARQLLALPAQGRLETQAQSFLSKEPLKLGHACSVCLAVFHHSLVPACPVCGTRFALVLPRGSLLKQRTTKPA